LIFSGKVTDAIKYSFDGMPKMSKVIYSVKKINNKYFHYLQKSNLSVFLFLLMAFILIEASVNFSIIAEGSYVPAAPSGPEEGYLDVEYEYSVYTTNPDAYWMFDWGDGTYSDWLSIEESENSITQSHSWSSIGTYQVRVKFKNDFFPDGVWSESLEVTIIEYYGNDIPNKPSTPSGKVIGCMGVEYSYSTSATDPKGDNVQYRFDWDDGNLSNWTSLVSSGTVSIVSYGWKHPGEYSILSQARDQNGLTSSWSNPLNIMIELDSDKDKLSDNTEAKLGSDANDSSDVIIVSISGIDYYIVQTDQHIFFYNSISENASILYANNEGNYRIDVNKDGKWDYLYDPVLGSIEEYDDTTKEESSFIIPWYLTLIIVTIIGIIVVIFILIKTGYIYIYEEYVGEE
jgi:hypothetical protein